jgi:hypothetical protein
MKTAGGRLLVLSTRKNEAGISLTGGTFAPPAPLSGLPERPNEYGESYQANETVFPWLSPVMSDAGSK